MARDVSRLEPPRTLLLCRWPTLAVVGLWWPSLAVVGLHWLSWAFPGLVW